MEKHHQCSHHFDVEQVNGIGRCLRFAGVHVGSHSSVFARLSGDLGFYKEPILSAFQRYGDEVGFSPLFESFAWGGVLAYLLFIVLVPSSFLILIGVFCFAIFRDALLAHQRQHSESSAIFLRFPYWYREIVDRTTREERRKLSYMWLALPLRTRLLYNAQHEEFRKWVELVVLSVS